VVDNNFIGQATSASQSFIRVVLVTANPELGDKLTFSVDSTEKISKFFYSVVGRGGIVTSGQVKGRKTFNVCTNFLMVPNFYVTVWYTRADGEVVSDALLVQLPANLKNKVSEIHSGF
jgi:Alpha-2-macroglobulin bait region domain